MSAPSSSTEAPEPEPAEPVDADDLASAVEALLLAIQTLPGTPSRQVAIDNASYEVRWYRRQQEAARGAA